MLALQREARLGEVIEHLDVDAPHLGVDAPVLYQRMSQALRATGRLILFSICEWGSHEPWKWGARAGGHMWRTTGDISDKWESIVDIGFNRQAGREAFAGPGRAWLYACSSDKVYRRKTLTAAAAVP